MMALRILRFESQETALMKQTRIMVYYDERKASLISEGV